MTPLHALDENDLRYYIHPKTYERFVSVTTVLSVIDKGRLPGWYAKLATISAIENLTRLNRATRTPFCDDRRCGQCLFCLMAEFQAAPRIARDQAADRGSRLHHIAEQYALTGVVLDHDQDIAPHVDGFMRFVHQHQVEFIASEVTVINRNHGYAGTLDAIVRCGWMPPKHRALVGQHMIIDYKTSNNIYPTCALQLAAYRNAETVLLPDGTELPMPPTVETALSLQTNNKGWWLRPCNAGQEAKASFHAALRLWYATGSDSDLVGRAMYKPTPIGV